MTIIFDLSKQLLIFVGESLKFCQINMEFTACKCKRCKLLDDREIKVVCVVVVGWDFHWINISSAPLTSKPKSMTCYCLRNELFVMIVDMYKFNKLLYKLSIAYFIKYWKKLSFMSYDIFMKFLCDLMLWIDWYERSHGINICQKIYFMMFTDKLIALLHRFLLLSNRINSFSNNWMYKFNKMFYNLRIKYNNILNM